LITEKCLEISPTFQTELDGDEQLDNE
jgi:hypothetical protein